MTDSSNGRGSQRRRSSSSSSSSAPSGPAPSQSAIQALTQLEALRTSKHYSPHKHLLEFSIGFTTNPANCIRDTPALLLQLVRNLYPDTSYLSVIYEQVQPQ